MTKTRKESERAKEWEEPNDLWVPPALVKRLKSNGYLYRWLRISIRGDDKENAPYIARRMREGYEFLTPETAPEWSDAPTREYGRFNSIISIGDLGLAIIPAEIAASRQQFYENKANEAMRAIKRHLLNQSDQKYPISDESVQRSTTGGQRKVDFDE